MVRPDKILKDLAKLWLDLGHEENHGNGDGTGVLRACAMTLITITDDAEDQVNVGETIARLMKEHPSRSVLIRLQEKSSQVLDSRVFAQCWMPFGQRQQICCEQIEITASMDSLDDVPGVVLPLAVADLPVILWCRSMRLFGTAAFPAIASMSDKVIVDTGATADPGKAIGEVLAQAGGDRLIGDLAWARLTRWRETIAQLFSNQECLGALPQYQRATVTYGGELRTETAYLAGWLQNGLAQAGSKIQVELKQGEGPAVAGVELSGADGRCDVSLNCDTCGGVKVNANKLETRAVFPEATDYIALQEELSITSSDAVFRATLPMANALLANARHE